VSLSVQPGEVRALVGEAAPAKHIGKAVLGRPAASVPHRRGPHQLEGVDLGACRQRRGASLIGAAPRSIPQNPLTALNPSRRIGPQMTDRLTKILAGRRQGGCPHPTLDEVQIREPDRVIRSYPHELSGACASGC